VRLTIHLFRGLSFRPYAVAAILCVLLCVIAAHARPVESRSKNVLILFSSIEYSQEYLATIQPAIRNRVAGPVHFYEAYLEDPQVEERAYRESLAEAFRTRYANVKLDVVIACNPAGLHFALEYRDKIFPGVPIVFNAVGTRELEGLNLSGVTGLTSAWGLRETIDLALRLQPETNTVAVIAGETQWDRNQLAFTHAELLRRRDKVKEIDLVGPINAELLEKVDALPPHTVVLFQAFPQLSNQPEFGTWKLLPQVARRVPTYSQFPRLCLNGCIGGAYQDNNKEVLQVGELAARILLGERPNDIPIAHATDLQIQVDWNALQRWHISEVSLPSGSVILNREPTLWERGWKYFVAGIAVILFQMISILALFWHRTRKRKAEAELATSEEKFSKTFLHSPLVLAISRTDDFRFIDINESFEQQLGWKREEVIGRTSLDLRLWANADQRAEFVSHTQNNGSVRDLEAFIRRKDGEIRTFLVSAEVLEVSGQNCTLSVGADITERKQAEEMLSTMSRRLIEAQEKERAWIARELHDDFNQRVAMVSVNLECLQRDLSGSEVKARSYTEEIQGQIKELGHDIHALSHRLHSSKLDYLGLASACKGHCSELSARQNIEIEFYSDNIPRELSQEISLCLFRVLQEALQNAVKYSGVQNFHVTLKGTSDEVELIVSDTGAGFDLDEAMNSEGLGLTSMKERLKLVDGQLAIESKCGHGTTIHARVPLNPETVAARADL
jgi:PAS domain S-box-containing protein